MMTVPLIVGARPNLMKIAAIYWDIIVSWPIHVSMRIVAQGVMNAFPGTRYSHL
jgi:hypothetical protein